MNSLIYSADGARHSKIVIIALLTATGIAGLSLCFHSKIAFTERAAMHKAGRSRIATGEALKAPYIAAARGLQEQPIR